jgi:hypothetical protein
MRLQKDEVTYGVTDYREMRSSKTAGAMQVDWSLGRHEPERWLGECSNVVVHPPQPIVIMTWKRTRQLIFPGPILIQVSTCIDPFELKYLNHH